MAHVQPIPAPEPDGSPISGPLLGLTEDELIRMAIAAGEPGFRGKQLARWLYVRRVVDPLRMSDLPAAFRQHLLERADPPLPYIRERHDLADGGCKLLYELADGAQVEGVLLPGRPGERTLCVSSQVGCPFDCVFCRTGTMGLQRNLSTAELLGQLVAAAEVAGPQPIRRLVFMGMGEPLANFDALVRALHLLLGPDRMGFGPRRITISTAGMPGRLLALRTQTGVQLAISLGGATEEQRARLMPRAARAANLKELLDECRHIPLAPTEHLTFELVLVRDENDRDADARALIRLTAGIRCKINLIPLNEHTGTRLRASSPERIAAFQQLLVRAGRPTSIRHSRGQEQLAACGQLATR